MFSRLKDIDYLILAYIVSLGILFILVIETPLLINQGALSISEELLEILVLTALLIIGSFTYRAYRREVDKKDRAYMEMTKHVGVINRQISQVKSLSRLVKRVPESKRDLKTLLTTISQKLLDIVPSEWAVVRIIDIKTGRTLSEQSATRGTAVLIKYHISNDDLLSGIEQPDITVIASQHENVHARVFCIMSSTVLSDEQDTLISTLASETALLYLIYTSIYYHQVKAT